MKRSILLAVSALVLGACAAAPQQPTRVSAAKVEAADELECVGKCLEFGDESCESCVDRCVDSTTPDSVATVLK